MADEENEKASVIGLYFTVCIGYHLRRERRIVLAEVEMRLASREWLNYRYFGYDW